MKMQETTKDQAPPSRRDGEPRSITTTTDGVVFPSALPPAPICTTAGNPWADVSCLVHFDEGGGYLVKLAA